MERAVPALQKTSAPGGIMHARHLARPTKENGATVRSGIWPRGECDHGEATNTEYAALLQKTAACIQFHLLCLYIAFGYTHSTCHAMIRSA